MRLMTLLAATVIVLVGMHLGAGLIAPFLLALVIVITIQPVRGALIRRSAPAWLATGAVIVLGWVVLVVIVGLTVVAGGLFVSVLRDHAGDIDAAAEQLRDIATGLGYGGGEAGAAVDIGAVIHGIEAAIGQLSGVAIGLGLVLVFLLYVAIDAPHVQEAVRRFTPGHERLATALRGFTQATRRYFAVNTVFGAIVAVIDGLLLWALDVPAPLAWAVLAFVTNYIPSIGFVIGVIPPVVLAFMTGGWQAGLAVLVGYCVVNVTLQVFVQPRFVSEAVQLGLTLTMLSVVLWTLVLGPAGALLAVPLTLLARAALLSGDDEGRRIARWVSGDHDEGGLAGRPEVDGR